MLGQLAIFRGVRKTTSIKLSTYSQGEERTQSAAYGPCLLQGRVGDGNARSVGLVALGLTPSNVTVTLMHTLDRNKHTISHLVIPSPRFQYLIRSYDSVRVQPLEQADCSAYHYKRDCHCLLVRHA